MVTLVRPSLSIHPREDETFRRVVLAVADSDQAATPQRLQGRLRAIYPHAVVRSRSPGNEHLEIWHVYRVGGPLDSAGYR